MPTSGSAPGGVGASSAHSPPLDYSPHRRGSRSSILASASEAASSAATASDRESIRSAGSSSRVGPSTPRQTARRPSRNDQADRNVSPISFYSSLEAPLTSPSGSRQGSIQADHSRHPHAPLAPRSPSPTHHAATLIPPSVRAKASSSHHSPPHKAKLNHSSANRRTVSDRTNTQRVKPPSSINRPASAQHDLTNSSSTSSLPHSIQAISTYSEQPYSSAQTSSQSSNVATHASDSKSDNTPYDSVNSKQRTITASRSVNTFLDFDNAASTRPRSKSMVGSAKSAAVQSPVIAQSLSSSTDDPKIASTSSNPATKTPTTAPSKISLRSRIFGHKPTKVASPVASSFDSGAETPSPHSARFPPSIYSEDSHSDSNLLDHSDNRSLEPAMPSPTYATSSLGHGRDDDGNSSEPIHGDPRANTTNTRKSSSASSFLRKTIRFRDKSAFMRQRPSASSMASDSAASAPASVPPSPLDPPSGSDLEESTRKQLVYKQISGRRGSHYRHTSSDQLDFAKDDASETRDNPALLPAVTETDLEVSPKPQRSLSRSATRSAAPPSLKPRPERLDASDRDAGTQSHISRSSSLRGSLSRSNSYILPSRSVSSDHAASSSIINAATSQSPRRRPRSGSAQFSPNIQPRTTSSPVQSSARRPLTAQGSPSLAGSPSSSSTSMQRASRPKTAESGHAYSGSLSSLRDILMVAHAISEEGAVYRTPPKDEVERFDSNSGLLAASNNGASPTDYKRPGLPPKNPLRKQRPAGASAMDSPLISSHSPSSHTIGIFPGPMMSRITTERPLGLGFKAAGPIGPIPLSSSTPPITEFQTPTPDGAQPSPKDTQTVSDYFRSGDLVRSYDMPLAQVSSRSPGFVHGSRSGSASPGQASFSSTQHLSRAPSSGSTSARIPGRHERSASDAASPLTDHRPTVDLGASTTSLHSELSSGTKKKKDTSGSRVLAFARDLAHRESSADQSNVLPTSGTFRLGKSGKAKNKDATTRPVIRRLYDGPLETEAAAAQGQAVENGLQSPMQITDGVSPGSSVVDLQPALGAVSRTPSTSNSRARSVSSSASTARNLLSPASIPLSTPQFGNTCSATSLSRSPSFIPTPWSISQDDLSQEHKRLVKRWFILRELLETERAYASDLAVARDIYLARAKMRAGITAPLSPLSVRSASIFSQLTSPEPSSHSRSSQPHLQQRGSASVLSPAAAVPSGRSYAPQRTLFRNASADGTAGGNLVHTSSSNQAASLTSLASSNPSNRSSMYTVSSQSSQTSDASQFALSSHPTSAGGLPIHFSIDGNPLSPSSGAKLHLGTTTSLPSYNVSPLSSTPATPTLSTSSGIFSPGLAAPVDGLAAGSADAPFSASDVRIVFAQLESCAAFADEMVVVLEGAVGKICNGAPEDASQLLAQGEVVEEAETDRVGQAFLKLMPRIEQVYSAYCSRHEASMAKLQELTSSQPKVGAFLSECTLAARAYTNAWDLSSLLIKPVQRVLKYPLLLKEILASTSHKHPDIENLSAASVEIQKVADNINEVKKRKDLVDQIVSGKTAKRSTSQRMQHGATKKLLRRQEKVKKLVLGPAEDVLADDGQYKELVAQFRQLEKATSTFAKRCLAWSASVKDAHIAQLQLLGSWSRTFAVDGMIANTEAEARVCAFVQLVETTFLGEFWSQLDVEFRTSLIPALQRIAALFSLPQAVIAKRDDREPDYTRYRAETTRGSSKTVDKKLTESANAFIALHMQLMNELPQFNYGVQTLLDLCIESLSRTQASYHLGVHRALIGFWQEYGPEGNTDIAVNEETDEQSMRHVNTVKIFWPLHSSMSEFAESLGIVSGVADERRSRNASMSTDSELLALGNLSPSSTNHFSPLQSTQALPDSEFASNVPDATSISQQIESITAVGSEELLEAFAARTSPSPLATPPLGSLSRASLSPQLHQQSLLGSPAPIGAQQPPSGPSTLRSTKSGGGLIGLLRSVGSSSAVGSRKNSQSTDTATDSFVDVPGSDPPTPISKDTPLVADAASAGGAVAPPMLPALTFNSGLFDRSDANFSSASEQRGEVTDDAASQAMKIMGTMAAVANSGARSSDEAKDGYPFIEYAVGDLFSVVQQDSTHMFGRSEHGVIGWVERENFVPLS